LKIRHQSQTTKTSTFYRGREAELAAVQFFASAGLSVVDVSHQNAMHDLEVDSFGRVQVKRAFLIPHNRGYRALKRGPHRDRQGATRRWQVKLTSASNARYPADAFDALCIAFPISSGWRFMILPARRLVVASKNYMRARLNLAKTTAILRWSETLSPGAFLFDEMEAKDGQPAPE
jgi:hypothetical protein